MSLFYLVLAAQVLGESSSVSTSTSLEVVSSYTTYLESATTLVENGVSYIATGPTTIVVSDCPCTRTHTYTTEYVTLCSGSSSGITAGSTSTAAEATGSSGSSGSTGVVAANAAGSTTPWVALMALMLL